MFTENLLESGAGRRLNRGWATTASFSFQLAIVAVLVVLPSIYPAIMAIDNVRPVSVPLFSPAPQVVTSAPRPSGGVSADRREFISVKTSTLTFGKARRGQPNLDPIGPPNVNLSGSSAGPYIPNAEGIPPTLKPAPPSRPVVISHLSEGNLVHRVQPNYPQIAKATRTEGTVIMTAIISKTGEIESLHVASGHPLLIGAAKEAVRQWRYRPYILNGEATEVETQITVNFKLND